MVCFYHQLPKSLRVLALLFFFTLTLSSSEVWAKRIGDGKLTIILRDAETKKNIPGRIHLKNAYRKSIAPKSISNGRFGDHFYIPGQTELELRKGQYTFELEAGPEYKTYRGHFEIIRHAEDEKVIEMHRFANLNKEGWWSGDIDFSRSTQYLPLVMRGEQLNLIARTSFQNLSGKWEKTSKKSPRQLKKIALKFSSQETGTSFLDQITPELKPVILNHGGVDRRNKSPLMFFLPTNNNPIELSKNLPTTNKSLPLSVELLNTAKALPENVIAVARTPYAWEMPLWLATEKLDAVSVITHHSLRNGVLNHETDGRPRDRKFYPGQDGNGRWAETIYHHILNAGFRISPVAGSGSGSNKNPAGINRTYAYCADEFNSQTWWKAVLAGQVFITNGPLLRPQVHGQPPGTVFYLEENGSEEFEIGLNLATRVKVDYLEIIKNGRVEKQVRLIDWQKNNGRLPKLSFKESGWFMIRARTKNQNLYQFASTGPYYVEKSGQLRISKRSVQFFIDWLDAYEKKMLAGPKQSHARALAQIKIARTFWNKRLTQSNAP